MALFSSRSIPLLRSPLGKLLLTLLVVLARPGGAAHVHIRDCSDRTPEEARSSQPHFRSEGAGAFYFGQDNETRVELAIHGRYPQLENCDQFQQQNISTRLSLVALGGSHSYHGETINSTCRPGRQIGPAVEPPYRILYASFRINKPAPLTAFDFKVDLLGSDNLTIGCFHGYLTPDVGVTMQSISLWSTVTTLFLVVLAAGWWEMSTLVRQDEDQEDGNSSRRTRKGHLTRIADCLCYIQFIFFAGALSINYPGFFQPMISSASWSTLMLQKGMVARHGWYYGINDGIHEINGTFGGTTGLEHMIQVMGAPVTKDTWLNIATLALTVLSCLLILIHIGSNLKWTKDWFSKSGSWSLESTPRGRYQVTTWVALRVFLSYFLLPLTAWTTYQLSYANMLPASDIILTTVVICLLLVACGWALSLRSPQNMGYLLIDDASDQVADETHSRTRDWYTLATFALLLIRGTVVGALSHFGTAQLAVLIACEVAQLLVAASVHSIFTTVIGTTAVTYAKLCVLLLCIGMLWDVASFQVASALGYAVLVLHAVFLFFLFFVPAVYDLCQLASSVYYKTDLVSQESDRGVLPQIFGLRQLARRPTRGDSFSTPSIVVEPSHRSSSSTSKPPSPDSPHGSPIELEPTSPEVLRTYFRSPRPERFASSTYSGKEFDSSSYAGRSTPSSESAGSSSSGSDGDIADETRHLSASTSQAWRAAVPANPNVDYSFREADLYYHKPRRLSFNQLSASKASSSSGLGKFAGKLGFKSNKTSGS